MTNPRTNDIFTTDPAALRALAIANRKNRNAIKKFRSDAAKEYAALRGIKHEKFPTYYKAG